MTKRVVHAVYLSERGYGGKGWILESPQIPGLVSSDKSLQRLLKATPDIVEFALELEPDGYDLARHEEEYLEAANVYVRRFADGSAERLAVWRDSILSAREGLSVQARQMIPAHPRSGARLIIASLPTDRVGWVRSQAGAFSAGVAAPWLADGLMYTLVLAAEGSDTPGARRLDDLGVDSETVLLDAFERLRDAQASDLLLSEPVEHVAGMVESHL